jgi:dihydroorotate dehydrogenase electron transfer subunit
LSRHFRAEIQGNQPVHKNHNLLTLAVPEETPEPRPGQFYMLEVNRGTDPLLKRAFSLFRRTGDGIQILYRVRGRGTSILRDMKEGAVIDVLGPLGNGYPAPEEKDVPIVVAGGIGIASVYSLIESLPRRAIVFYGARTKADLLMLQAVRGISKEVVISTDDGSEGRKGVIGGPLDVFLSDHPSLNTRHRIYACGPYPMLREIATISRARNIRTSVSMEEQMACGIGACLGCVVKAHDGYSRVCKEGPVYDAATIAW